MKVLKHGLTWNEVITFTCNTCDCVYTVNDSSNCETEIGYYPLELNTKKVVYYYSKCPECGSYKNIGCNPNEAEGLFSPWQIIFNRPDWNDRDKVSIEEEK